tara:strand:+ start:480 stop:1103 length:624 start_codon:yes stop_codon:yes gene_type:complete
MSENNYISFLSSDNDKVYIDIDILKNSPVLYNILNLENNFSDVPKTENGSYLLLSSLSKRSIVVLFRFLSLNIDNTEYKNVYNKEDLNLKCFIDSIKYLPDDEVDELVTFASSICVNLPSEIFHQSRKKPLINSDDHFNEYQFFEFNIIKPNVLIHAQASSELSLKVYETQSRILNENYLEKGWDVVGQEDTEKYSNYYLRKPINSN